MKDAVFFATYVSYVATYVMTHCMRYPYLIISVHERYERRREMIQCKDLRKNFDSHEVLKGISFDIPKGSIFGLLGPSGAGKTTLIKILTGQLSYDEGEVEIMDKNPEKLTGKDKKSFGIMMDNFGVYERFTCRDNLSVFADIYNVPKSRINGILDEVGLLDASKTQASDLSKGITSSM